MTLKEPLRITRTARFAKSARELEPAARKKLQKQLKVLVENPRHPYLQVKKIKGTRSIFEARVNDAFRFTFEFGEEREIILRAVGPHNSTLNKP